MRDGERGAEITGWLGRWRPALTPGPSPEYGRGEVPFVVGRHEDFPSGTIPLRHHAERDGTWGVRGRLRGGPHRGGPRPAKEHSAFVLSGINVYWYDE